MDIRAILLVGGLAADGANPVEKIAGVPIAYLDALGLPIIERLLRRLHHFGICATTLITEVSAEAAAWADLAIHDRQLTKVEASGDEFWSAAEETFQQYAVEGAELVVALRIGPYVEVDYEELIQHHIDHRCTISMAVDAENSGLDLFVLNASGRLDAQELFQSHLHHLRRDCEPFKVSGYINRLQTAADLRRLAVDGLMARNAARPEGMELKPGVFVGRGARIHRNARVVAPAFIGAGAKVHASALITRCSALEHHTEVDCATAVENSTLLPFTRLGAGLDVMHSVVGFRRLAHLLRNVEVEITDAKLVDMVPVSPVSRLAGSTAALFAFIPKQIYRGFFAPSQREAPAESPECAEAEQAALDPSVLESPASGPESSEFPSTLAVVRRYGDH